ncbi:protein of unknown function DUF547 [Macleaya cordata]|uniref:DUF547 domain-containing protein n=1 Tax=Macleaya cordata TaxID=56857 RepID=A0A200R5R9_MACCD|nr:protein of unknown function DUF547 [Macleaya cordata]
MLDHEEMVHDILEHVIHRSDGAPLHIPSFLPPQMKELLTELATVEDEIARLEGEVRNLQRGLNHELEISKEFKSKQWQHGNNLMSNQNFNFSVPPQNPEPTTTTKWVYERMPFEAKSLHFISKAIKGDYKISDFTRKERMGNSAATTDQKENYALEEVGLFPQEKVSRKSGIQKPASSPLRPPRHQTSKPIELQKDISFDLPPKSLPKPGSSPLQEINSQKSQPNKLSESIMKCLIFIFVRLMRTSRALELEKLSTVSRSTHSSFNLSRSFRTETKTTSLSLQKDSRQQDPYGIFDIEDSIPRDIGPYKNLVRFTSSSLDHKSISSSSSIPLLQKLRVLMNNLQNVDLRFLTHQQKLAFWINMYNACIMHGFLVYGVPSSPEKLLALMNKVTVSIGGNKINALAIEHFILRQPSSSNMKDVSLFGEESEKEAAAYNIYGLESPEPNVTFALCCGTRSSPSVRIYTADGVLAELERSKLEYLQASIAVTSTKRFVMPELLLRNMLDFASDTDSLVEWVCHQLPTSGSLRKLMVDCLRGHNNGKISNIVEKMPYELEFQYLLSV